MNRSETAAFEKLFGEACEKCFGAARQSALSESECRLFSTEILQKTGLVIGWKSLKNYSQYFFADKSAGRTKHENPSVATLDTLARYVQAAPPTDEPNRKRNESHFPYWFRYREEFYRSTGQVIPGRSRYRRKIILFAAVTIVCAAILLTSRHGTLDRNFTEDFHTLSGDSLAAHGWFVKWKDELFWQRRDDNAGVLTLFTLRGDNWPDSGHTPHISNLLLRKIPSEDFTAEIHLKDFVPRSNWEQAGMILLEDTSLTGRSLRFTLAYNDYAGGYPRSRDILVQAIVGSGTSKPEEIAHEKIFTLGTVDDSLIAANLAHSALRIEKDGKKIRLLFADGAMANSAFREVTSHDIDFVLRYVGVFALKGFVEDTTIEAVKVSGFEMKMR